MPQGQAPQIQRRERWVELPEEYAGFQVRLWINAPTRLWNSILSKKQGETDEEQERIEAERLAALQTVVLEHNGWLSFEGQPFPSPATEAFWDEIPTELAACVLTACSLEAAKLPNSMAPKKRR